MQTVVVGTAGHIDHGKSALVRALTGIDPDRLKDEIVRGITIDLGFAHTREGDVQIAFVDVPGHERFVRNMLAGAGGIDAVLLVASAVESVKPQTREHFEICRLLAVDRGVIALTKADIAEPAAIDRAEADVRALVAGSFLEHAPIVRVSALTGQGLPALRTHLATLAGGRLRMGRDGVVRLPVDRAFTVKGFGTVVTGTLASGTIAVGDSLAILPGGDDVRVRGLQVHGAAVERVIAPQRVAVNVAGIDGSALHRGVTLATRGSLAVTRRADVRVFVLDEAKGIANGARVRAHHGTSDAFARVSICQPAEPTGPPGGSSPFARLRFEKPLVLTRGDRLVLRGGSPVSTMAGAVVLDPEPAAGGIRRASALDRFQRLDQADAASAAAVFLDDEGVQGLTSESLVRRAGLTPDEARRVLAELATAGEARAVGDRDVTAPAIAALRAQVLQELGVFHRQHPVERGMPRETLRDRAAGRTPAAVYEAVLADLVRDGAIRATDRVALVSHRVEVSAADQQLEQATLARLRAAGLAPPDPSIIAQELKAPAPAVARALQALVRAGQAVRTGDIVFARDALDALRTAVKALRAGQPPSARVTLDVAAFKAQHGLSRKYAIPLLEWLDRERVTRRLGDVRVVL
ncbi:MAG TPA: selenocysteine-specific translation elongation factor [Vicinamibacterales bacterium]|nr:selenocysteine-specific translation elongation factor [Vicinamibacterales bacterium]